MIITNRLKGQVLGRTVSEAEETGVIIRENGQNDELTVHHDRKPAVH